MAKHALEEILSLCVALTVQGQSVENTDVDQTSVVVPATTIPLERRCEARKANVLCRHRWRAAVTVDHERVAVGARGNARELRQLHHLVDRRLLRLLVEIQPVQAVADRSGLVHLPLSVGGDSGVAALP